MNGMSLHYIAQKTGVNRGTIRSLLSRHPELQSMPYSTKAGGARVYLPAFVKWLATHQGADAAAVANVAPDATTATTATKPATLSGSLVRELRVTMGPALATKVILAVAGIPDAFKPAVPVQPTLALEGPPATILRFPSLFSLKYPVDHYTAAVALALIPARVEALAKSLGIEDHLEALTMRDLVAIWSLDKGNHFLFKSVEDMARNIDKSRGVA